MENEKKFFTNWIQTDCQELEVFLYFFPKEQKCHFRFQESYDRGLKSSF